MQQVMPFPKWTEFCYIIIREVCLSSLFREWAGDEGVDYVGGEFWRGGDSEGTYG